MIVVSEIFPHVHTSFLWHESACAYKMRTLMGKLFWMLEGSLKQWDKDTHGCHLLCICVCFCTIRHGIEFTTDKLTDSPHSMQTSQIPTVMVKRWSNGKCNLDSRCPEAENIDDLELFYNLVKCMQKLHSCDQS